MLAVLRLRLRVEWEGRIGVPRAGLSKHVCKSLDHTLFGDGGASSKLLGGHNGRFCLKSYNTLVCHLINCERVVRHHQGKRGLKNRPLVSWPVSDPPKLASATQQ